MPSCRCSWKYSFLRGQIGQNLDTSESVCIGDAAGQAEQAMYNINMLLTEKLVVNLKISAKSPFISSTHDIAKKFTVL